MTDNKTNHWDKRANSEDENRIEQLTNLVEKHTRTERHLEQHSDISSPKNLAHAEKIQEEREDEIDNLKHIIADGTHVKSDELDNLKRNYNYTEGYLDHNSDTMDKKTLEKTKEKQAHRKDQIDCLE